MRKNLMILPQKSPRKLSGSSRIAIAKAVAFSFLFFALFLSGCSVKPTPDDRADTIDGNLTHEHTKETGKSTKVSFVAVGDNLIHKQLITGAKIEGKNEYDFKPFYSEIKSVIEGADIAFINQETLFAGEKFGYSGYPVFNAPTAVGDALIDTGFDVVNHASNHTMDRGKNGVLAMVDYWSEQNKTTILGIHKSAEDRAKNKIVEINDIKIGFLGYTYGLNGFVLPKNMPFLISLIDTKTMQKEIAAIRAECDFLIVSMHWGEEYVYKPNKRQKELAAFLADARVDLVIGHHPHVLQSVEWIEAKDGNKTLIYYSLGNFISAQNKAPRMLGGLAYLTIVKNGKNVYIENPKLLGLITHRDRDSVNFKVYPLSAYSEEISERHFLYGKEKDFTLPSLKKLYTEIITKEFL
ncbi:capsular polysaccharide biosynthesis protein [Campylobacterota bacterium]|nr:capsular polysaccharide biosynthesis protein [Campylobacterota bacterium]